MTEYLEHEKLKRISKASQAQGEFLDWLTHKKGLVLCIRTTNEIDNLYAPAHEPINNSWRNITKSTKSKLMRKSRQCWMSFVLRTKGNQ